MIKKLGWGLLGLLSVCTIALTAFPELQHFVPEFLTALLVGKGLSLAVFPNVTDIVATTIEKRTKKIQDNVTKNNGLLAYIKDRGNVREITGGSVIFEELSFAENANAGWYSGYDLLPTAVQDVLSAAQFDIKQAAVPVIISGLDELRNDGPEQMIDLMTGRLDVAESTMANLIAAGLYSDGTAAGGKQLVGLDAAVPTNPATGTYGGIDRATWTFWRSKISSLAGPISATNVQPAMNAMWAQLVRGMDRPNVLIMDSLFWLQYLASLQALQRFTGSETGKLGFPTIKYMDADCILDGGIGGFAAARTCYFLNTKFLYYRPHRRRNMVPLSPNRRYAVNQDAEVQILAFAGNMTCSGAQYQGRLVFAS